MTSAYPSSGCDSSVASPSNSAISQTKATRLDRHMNQQRRKTQGDDTKSDTEISNLTTTSSESSASGNNSGLLGRMLRSSSQKNDFHHTKSSKPLHQFADQDEEGLLVSPTVSSSWALSTCISSIPEEQGEDRPPAKTSAKAHDNNMNQGGRHKEVISPSLSSLARCSLPSPLSQRSLGNSIDNSSVAMESHASGVQSAATGFYSEVTQVHRNTSGVPLPPKRRDIERGTIPIQLPNGLPPLSLIPSGRTLDKEAYNGQPIKRNENKKSFCRGKQGWIIALLIGLLFFGVITLVVSFVVSNKANENAAEFAAKSDDDIGFVFNPQGEDDTLLNDNGGYNDTATINATFPSTTIPTANVSLDEEDAILADAVEDLLTNNEPSTRPSASTSSTLSFSPSVSPTGGSFGLSLVPTDGPSDTPTMNPLPSPTTPQPTTPHPTESPTSALPLLYLEAVFAQEAQLWGESNNDAAGSSTALSGDGRIFLMGSPNADSTTDSNLERIGRVHVYERFTHQTTEHSEWMLRATVQGMDSLNQLGFSLATNYDGSIIAISEPTAENRRGRVTIYEWQPNQQLYEAQQVVKGTDTTDHFGIAISMSDDGRRLAVGAPYHSTQALNEQLASTLRGQVKVFQYSAETQEWELMDTDEDGILLGSASLDWFGWSVSLSRDGEVLCIGAPRNTEFGGYVQCFEFDGSVWGFMGPPILNLVPPVKLDDRFGHAVSVTTTGSRPDRTGAIIRVAVGAPWKDIGNTLNSGVVAIYEWQPGTSTWSLDANGALGSVLKEEEPGFYNQLGYSMKLDGDVVAVGIPGWNNRRGMVDIFWLPHAFGGESVYNNSDKQHWNQLPNRLAGDSEGDDFGFSVSLGLPRTEEGPVSVIIASGAIMVSSSSVESRGYSKVFHRGQIS